MSYDFSKLTPNQQALLTYQGWSVGCELPQPSKRTVKKLIERGLVSPHKYKENGITFDEYEVPIDVHIAWCKHCARKDTK